jgi:hypothetical protein
MNKKEKELKEIWDSRPSNSTIPVIDGPITLYGWEGPVKLRNGAKIGTSSEEDE